MACPDSDGQFRELLWIPDDLPAGAHTLSAVARDSQRRLDAIHMPMCIVEDRTASYKTAMLLEASTIHLGFGLLVLNRKQPRS